MTNLDLPLRRRKFLALAGAGAAGFYLSSPTRSASEDQKTAPSASEGGKQLVVRTEQPFNAEGPLDKLSQSFHTPFEHFYVRSNGHIPKLKPDEYRLSIEGLVNKPLTFSLHGLAETFRRRSADATLMCAGNRRREHSAVKKVGGVQWDAGAIGTAQWHGFALADVLRAAGLKESAKHVWFESLDEVVEEGKTIHFGASIPLAKALADDKDVPGALLAHGMNGEPLPPEHGFPLRAIVPGFIGARSVKWLGKIIVSDRPSDNYFLDRSYKVVQKGEPAELAATEPIYQFPITSAICLPAADAKVDVEFKVSGYALPPGLPGRTIAKVEISADGGKTWKTAELTHASKPFCWQLWRAKLTLPAGRHTLVVRATDSAGALQPEKVEWNLKGYLYNAWPRVEVSVS